MRLILFPYYLLIMILTGCDSPSPNGIKKEIGRGNSVSQKAPNTSGVTINIQPFSDIPDSLVKSFTRRMSKLYGEIHVNKPISLPKQAFYLPRKRYRADSLINILGRNTTGTNITIGITTKDISTTKDKYIDWGVMGLGFCPGNACVVSTFRLDKKNLADQLFKVCIHELGHNMGLPHCETKNCYMQDAEGGNPTDNETGFCPNCKAVLISKGWKFN